MFSVGDYIIYGGNGVCKVESIGPMSFGGAPTDRLYYTLIPIYKKESRVFTPIDNQKIVMRPIISKEDAVALIADIENIETLWVKDEKRREDIYKEVIKSCDCREWIKIIKTLHARKIARIEAGKKVTASDEKYLHIAQENLYGELAIALDMEREDVEEYIDEKVKEAQKLSEIQAAQ